MLCLSTYSCTICLLSWFLSYLSVCGCAGSPLLPAALAVASRGCRLVAARALLPEMALLVAAHGLQGAWAQLPCDVCDLPGPGVKPVPLCWQAGSSALDCWGSPELNLIRKLFLSQKSVMKTTWGVLDPPVGNTRLSVVRLVSSLLQTNTSSINGDLMELNSIGVILVRCPRKMSSFALELL